MNSWREKYQSWERNRWLDSGAGLGRNSCARARLLFQTHRAAPGPVHMPVGRQRHIVRGKMCCLLPGTVGKASWGG